MVEHKGPQPMGTAHLAERLMDWLRAQGIEITEPVIRHVLGIVKSTETKANTKRES